jgi:hypothetical protein
MSSPHTIVARRHIPSIGRFTGRPRSTDVAGYSQLVRIQRRLEAENIEHELLGGGWNCAGGGSTLYRARVDEPERERKADQNDESPE